MTVNLKLLSVFVLVAEQSSFRKAAEELDRSQSAVSTQIRQLEEQLAAFQAEFPRVTVHVREFAAAEMLTWSVFSAISILRSTRGTKGCKFRRCYPWSMPDSVRRFFHESQPPPAARIGSERFRFSLR